MHYTEKIFNKNFISEFFQMFNYIYSSTKRHILGIWHDALMRWIYKMSAFFYKEKRRSCSRLTATCGCRREALDVEEWSVMEFMYEGEMLNPRKYSLNELYA